MPLTLQPTPAERKRAPRLNPWTDTAWLYRHRSRAKLAKALEHTGRPGRAVDVRNCQTAMVATTPDGELIVSERTGIPAAVVYDCGHRLCPDCAARAARRASSAITKKLTSHAGPGAWDDRARDVRFLTLTQPARSDETAAQALERLEDALRRLLRTKEWAEHVTGGVVKLEIEWSNAGRRRRAALRAKARASDLRHRAAGERQAGRTARATSLERAAARAQAHVDAHAAAVQRNGDRGAWWHAHAHVLVIGRYWRHAALLERWRACMAATGRYRYERHLVDVGELRAFGGARIEAPRSRDAVGIAQEVAKYVSKPINRDVPQERLTELLVALQPKARGARLLPETPAARVRRRLAPPPTRAVVRATLRLLDRCHVADWRAELESEERKRLKRGARRSSSGGGGRRMLRPFGVLYGLKLDEEHSGSREEGADDLGMPDGPIGVGLETRQPIMREHVRWSSAFADLELRRAIRAIIHDEHERRRSARYEHHHHPPNPRGSPRDSNGSPHHAHA